MDACLHCYSYQLLSLSDPCASQGLDSGPACPSSHSFRARKTPESWQTCDVVAVWRRLANKLAMACWRCASVRVRVRVRVGVCVCITNVCVRMWAWARAQAWVWVSVCWCVVGGMDCLHLETLAWQVGNLMCKMFDILVNINLLRK